MEYVYILKSKIKNNKYYTGITKDVEKRFKSHNSGQSPYTSKFKPWELITYIAFSDSSKAHEFERYLKTGSGRAFAIIKQLHFFIFEKYMMFCIIEIK